jgi:hypothetical protein
MITALSGTAAASTYSTSAMAMYSPALSVAPGCTEDAFSAALRIAPGAMSYTGIVNPTVALPGTVGEEDEVDMIKRT